MKIITPVQITEARLIESSIPEDDHDEWDADTTYDAGDRCILLSTHSVYQRLVAGQTPDSPDIDVENWMRVGPTNRWAMFDRVVGTLSRAEDEISVRLAPGLVRGFALVDVAASDVTVTMHDGDELVYERSISLRDESNVLDWESYFWGEFLLRRTLIFTDLPPYGTGEVTVTLTGGGEISVGTVVLGSVFDLGITTHGLSLGITDYSVKSTDAFGATSVVERTWAKRMTVPVVVPTMRVDEVYRRLSTIRATPVIWVAGDNLDQSVVYGFYKDWGIDVAFAAISHCSLTIEGLT